MSGGLESYPYDQIQFSRINATSDGDNTVVTGKSGFKIRVLGYSVTANAAGVIAFQDSAASPVIFASFEEADSASHSYAGTFESPAFDVTSGLNLEVTNAASVDTLGHVSYVFLKV
jgi:hypothetical protein